jgi:hypothetical protein
LQGFLLQVEVSEIMAHEADEPNAAVGFHPQQVFEVDRLAFDSRFCARFLAASIKALCDDGMPRRAIASSLRPLPLRTMAPDTSFGKARLKIA